MKQQQLSMDMPRNAPVCRSCRRRAAMESEYWESGYHPWCEMCLKQNVEYVNRGLGTHMYAPRALSK